MNYVELEVWVDEVELLEASYSELFSRNQVLQNEFSNLQEFRYSSKEKAASRIEQLTNELGTLKREVDESECIETVYQQHKQKMQKLEEKVFRSEKERRSLSNRIQDCKGNMFPFAIVIHTAVNGESSQTGNELRISPDETKLCIMNSLGKMVPYSFDAVFNGNFGSEEILKKFSDLFYPVFDGRNIVLLNYSTSSLAGFKEHLLFGRFSQFNNFF